MNRRTNESGFTIIEVVLVLAIAGLILVMALIALPALQRGQRDTQRNNDLSRLQTAITNYTSSNRGSLPSSNGWNGQNGFVSNYLLVGGDTFIDPNGAPASNPSATSYTITEIDGDEPIGNYDTTQNVIFATRSATCSPDNSSTVVAAGTRKIAFRIALEGGGHGCVNN